MSTWLWKALRQISCFGCLTLSLTAALSDGISGTAHAQTISLSTLKPGANAGVENPNFSTSSATNTQLNFVPNNYVGNRDASDPVVAIGQTFTAGNNMAGYTLNSISIPQVSWGPTSWDYNGGSVTLNVIKLSDPPGAPALRTETAVPSGTTGVGTNSTPTSPQWLTFNLSSPLTLYGYTQYGFTLESTGNSSNGEFFIEWDGTSGNSYAGGFAISTEGQPNNWWDGGNRASDRAFVANMTARTGDAPIEQGVFEFFDSKYPGWSDLGNGVATPIDVSTTSTSVAMNNGGVPGTQWTAQGAGYNFDLTIQDATGVDVGALEALLEKLPEPYFRAYAEVSNREHQDHPGSESDGVAVYADLAGAAGHGSKSYLNLQTDVVTFGWAGVITHEAGHTLQQIADEMNPGKNYLQLWADAATADGNRSISGYGDTSVHEELAEFAAVYASALDLELGGNDMALDELYALSPQRFLLWEEILQYNSGTVAIPEPSSMVLSVLACAGWLMRRRNCTQI